MAAADAIAPGAVIDGRYELLSHIGTGGFGLVYKARQLNTGQLVAVKIARHFEGPGTGGAVARFQREMSVVAQLGHPNIVRLIDAGQLPDGRLFTVLQLVHGITLDALLSREGPMRPPEAQHLMTQVLDALCSAHDLGVIHRDLKPANIMVTDMGARRNAMVLDFGIATFVKSVRDEGYQSLTPDGSVGGTPAYMAPEQLHGQEPNPQTDIYAWGLVFLECLTGQRVVRGGTMAQNMFIHLRPEPHAVPPVIAAHQLGRMLRRALAKDPTQRYTDARGALDELSACDVTRLPRLPRPELPPGTGRTPLMSTADPNAQPADEYASHLEVEPTEQWSASYSPRMHENTNVQPRRSRHSDNSSQNVIAERRQLTSIACEIGPLAALAESLAPGELRELLGQFRGIVESAIAGLEGTIERTDGGRIVCYFGFPIAHEDDANRAAQAALEICRQVRLARWRIPEALGGVDVHVGVHTGMVVTSSVLLGQSEDVSIVGDVSRVAVMLQDNAEPGSILVSEAVHRSLRERFECEAAGTRHLGPLGAAPVYRVLGTAESANRASTATPSVGRENELATLVDRWEEVCEGRGQVVLITGEIGIGKSHVTSTFRRHIGASKHLWLDCVSSPYLSGSALHPVVHALQGFFQIDRSDPPAASRRKIGKSLAANGVALPHLEEHLIALLALDEATSDAPPPRDLFRQLQEELIELFLALAERSPLVLRFEDLHWADPTTQELVRLLVDQTPLGSIFTLGITRPTYTPDWQTRSHVTRVQLSRLSRRRVEAMVRAIGGDRLMPDELVAHLAGKTDGVPLFVEELTKAVLESSAVIAREDRYDLAGDLGSLAIPESLRGSLMARLDRLGPSKEIAQIASVIGREFSFALLAAVCDQPPRELEAALDQIVHAELMIQRGRPPGAKYVFKHGLIQDTAYESLLEKTRRHYHGRIADALSSRFLDIVQAQPELVAHHYTEARSQRAVDYWLRAGTRAAERSANLESIQHLTKGLELLAREPESPERDERELTLIMRLGAPLIATKGYASEEVEQNYSRALALCRRLGEARELVPSLWGLWLFYQVRGKYTNALEVGSKLLALAEESGEAELFLCAHQALGATLYLTGAIADARCHLEHGIEVYDPEAHQHMAVMFAQDPNVFCRAYLSRVDCAEGFPDRARAGAEASIAAARALEHPHSLAFALCITLPVYMAREEYVQVELRAAEAMAVCTEYRLVHWLAFARFMQGAAVAYTRDLEQGIAAMKQGLADWRAADGRVTLPYFHALLAHHLGRAGRVDEALDLLQQVPATNYEGSEHLFECTWQRTHARLLLRRDAPGDRAQAGALLEQAVASARRTGDRLEELAALTQLIALRGSVRGIEIAADDPGAEPRARLRELLGQLDEGRDLPVMQAARRALDPGA
jgi:predicted ATPase/serine/threonine protein kinase